MRDHFRYNTALGRRNPAHVATARPSGQRNPAHEGYGPAQGQGAASPSPEAGFRGFSRPGSTGLFLIESRGGGLSPAGRVFFIVSIHDTAIFL